MLLRVMEGRWNYMTEKEMMQRNIEDFSRIQTYMLLAEEGSDVYKALRD